MRVNLEKVKSMLLKNLLMYELFQAKRETVTTLFLKFFNYRTDNSFKCGIMKQIKVKVDQN